MTVETSSGGGSGGRSRGVTVGERELARQSWRLRRGHSTSLHRFSSHPHFQALLKPTVLALVTMMLVDWTVSAASTGIRQVPSDASFEEAFTPFASELSVVLPTGLVAAYNALDVLVFISTLRGTAGLRRIRARRRRLLQFPEASSGR